MPARVIQVILDTELRHGKGTESDPVRIVPQLFTLDGELICSYDVCSEKATKVNERGMQALQGATCIVEYGNAFQFNADGSRRRT